MTVNPCTLKLADIISRTWLIFALFGNACAAPDNNETFNLTEISQGIYVHQGKHVDLDHVDHDDIANIGFITGDECIAVIDTGGSVAIGNALDKAIKRISSLPVCYVINTHVHFDHVLGNIAFKEYEPQFVGHENLVEEMEHSQSFFLSEFAADLGENPADTSIIGPDIVVSDKLNLDLGNRMITLSAHPPSHSYTDISIYDEKTGTLWLSDLLFHRQDTGLRRQSEGMVDDHGNTENRGRQITLYPDMAQSPCPGRMHAKRTGQLP